jgi:hypothetical protein
MHLRVPLTQELLCFPTQATVEGKLSIQDAILDDNSVYREFVC